MRASLVGYLKTVHDNLMQITDSGLLDVERANTPNLSQRLTVNSWRTVTLCMYVSLPVSWAAGVWAAYL